MNIRLSLGSARRNAATNGRGQASAAVTSVMMTCEDCDLSGGPFEAAEAAHLRAIHDRLFHGISTAA